MFFFAFPVNATAVPVSKKEQALQEKKQSYEATKWIFAKVKIQGSLVGKDRFLHYYAIEPGQIYEDAQHKHSVATIQGQLRQEGYLDAHVETSTYYNTKNKTVAITLSLNPGNQFTIEKVSVELKGIPSSERGPLLEKIQTTAHNDLLHHTAEQEAITGEVKKIQNYLLGEGYVHSTIELETVRLGSSSIHLHYTAKVQQKKRYLFRGNQFYNSEFLMKEFFLTEAQGISVPLDIVVEDIQALYKQKGFDKVKVKMKKEPNSVVFTIQEGPRLEIKKVALRGIPPSMEEHIKKAAASLYALTYYDEESIKEGIAHLTAELAQLGYWEAKITPKTIKSMLKDSESNSKVDGLQLIITLNPGERKIAAGLAIKGYLDLAKEEPFKSFMASMPQPLNPYDVEIQRKWLVNYFRQKGFLYATVNYELKHLDRKKKGIDQPYILIWRIDTKGGPVRFGKTKVTGLHRMKPHTVLQELHYHEGDIWDKEKIEMSVKRLRSLGMFESISIEQATMEPEQLPFQPMIIKCIEEDPFEVRTRFGLQFVSKSFTHISWSTYKLGGSFVWKNPSGIADQLRLDADITRFTRNIGASYEVPRLGPCPLRTIANVYSNRFDQPLSTSRQHRLYKEAHDGVSVSFNHVHPWCQSNVMVGFEVNKLYGISHDLAKIIQFEPRLINQHTPYFYLEPSFTVERLDNKTDPCKGFLTFFSFKAMVPPDIRGGAFVRALFEQSFYRSLFFNVVGALRFRFGHIFNAKFCTILPTERFYLGGATTLRGYETNMVPPLNDLECGHNCLWVPVGGKSMVNINAEIRFPIYRPISGVVFTDMGVLAQDTFADIAANKWLGASGFGLRCATPIGPLRFDIGWKWKKRSPKDESLAWFVTLGHAF